jgi:hypothetical protein
MKIRNSIVRSLLLIGKTRFSDNIDERLGAANEMISLLTDVCDDMARVSSTYSPLDSD